MKFPKLKLTGRAAKVARKVKDHAPEILMVAGTAGVTVGTVMVCKATIKSQNIIFDSRADIEPLDPSDAEDSKEIRKIKLETYYDVSKAFAPGVVIMLLSIGSMWGSNYILRKRCAELAAAYTLVNQAYMNYRKAVREKFGADVDQALATSAYTESLEYVGEDGKKHKTKALVVNPDAMYSPYARFFDESCREWDKDPATSLFFLSRLQAQWNDTLIARCTKEHPIGYVTYNEVLKSIGLPPSPAFANAGWVYDPSNGDIDNKIDFGIFQAWKPRHVDFVNGYENVIILDFNVDGDISYILNQYQPDIEKLPCNYRKTGVREIQFVAGGEFND